MAIIKKFRETTKRSSSSWKNETIYLLPVDDAVVRPFADTVSAMFSPPNEFYRADNRRPQKWAHWVWVGCNRLQLSHSKRWNMLHSQPLPQGQQCCRRLRMPTMLRSIRPMVDNCNCPAGYTSSVAPVQLLLCLCVVRFFCCCFFFISFILMNMEK